MLLASPGSDKQTPCTDEEIPDCWAIIRRRVSGRVRARVLQPWECARMMFAMCVDEVCLSERVRMAQPDGAGDKASVKRILNASAG